MAGALADALGLDGERENMDFLAGADGDDERERVRAGGERERERPPPPRRPGIGDATRKESIGGSWEGVCFD